MAQIAHTFSICLTDIPKHCIQKGKNGKKYINLRLISFDAPNQYGKDGMIAVDIPKDKWENGNTYTLGYSKSHEQYERERAQSSEKSAGAPTTPTETETAPEATKEDTDGLPF